MGIPSFYKHLLQTIKGLATSERKQPPQVFALDLNCAVYYCVRKISASYSEETRDAWENALVQEVVGYIQKMRRLVAPTDVTYIALDGVAPMAKIKQQRARRFKSSVLAAEEARVKAEAIGSAEAEPARWNTNAITPGTQFMQRLAKGLHDYSASVGSGKIVVSSAEESGEGEQKIMAWIRSHPYRDIVVYGLDADLIVLALLEHGNSGRIVDLFREETEINGSVKSDIFGSEKFLYLHMEHLANVLYETWVAPGRSKKEFLWDFTGAMNLLGNDFVPHGMALKIHDEGIETVLSILKEAPETLIDAKTRSYNSNTLLRVVIPELVKIEEIRMLSGIRRKLGSRIGASSASSQNPVERAMAQLNDAPIEWAAEKCLVEQRRIEGQEKPVWNWRKDWRSQYNKHGLWSPSVQKVVQSFLQTLSWTIDYYVGKPVALDWYYPWLLPPLFSDIAKYGNPEMLQSPAISVRAPLKPLEQLAMVLPVTGFGLLPPKYAVLPLRYPHAWPDAWDTFSFGRRFLWECEPLIPLIQPDQIQRWIKELEKS